MVEMFRSSLDAIDRTERSVFAVSLRPGARKGHYRKVLFRQSRTFQADLTALYDFVNPTAAAMWNLRWQVAGYVAESPGAKPTELQSRFVTGSGIGSANLRRHCVDSSWDSQLNQLGALALYQAIGHLEGWVDSLDVGTAKSRKALMFPSTSSEPSAQEFLDSLGTSERMKRAFGTSLASYKHCFSNRLEDLLTVLRTFKVARNHITHSGGRVKDATQQILEDGRLAAHGLGHRARDLQLPTIDEDGRVVVGLLAAQGACSLVHRVVATLDHALACTPYGEEEAVAQWRLRHGRQTLSSTTERRDRRLRLLAGRASLPRLADADALYELLGERGLVT